MPSARKVGTNESIHTYGNGTREYTSLQTWEDAHTVDCVATTTSHILECYDDAASFNDYVAINGATTNATYFRIIRPAAGQGHDGTPNNGVHFISTTDTPVCNISESYSQLQDIIATLTVSSAQVNRPTLALNAANAAFVGCMGVNGLNSSTGSVGGITNNNNNFVIDCLANNNEVWGFRTLANNAITPYNYNNTATNNGTYGVLMTGVNADAVHTFKNTLASGNAAADFYSDAAGTEVVTYCASSDATADDWGGAGNRINKTFAFVDAANDNFALALGDTGARDYGIDLSQDATYPFNDDIHRSIRSGSWDIGFDENILEILASIAVSASSITDVQTFINILSDQITSQSSLIDAQGYLEILLSTIESTSVVEAIQTYLATLNSVIQSISSLTDLQTYVETLQGVIQSSSSITDFIVYVEIVQTVVISSSSITDAIALVEILLSTIQSQASLTDIQSYFAALLLTMTSLSTIEDKQSYVHNLQALIQSQASLSDIQNYINSLSSLIVSSAGVTDILTSPDAEALLSTIISQAGVYDYYKKAGMGEATAYFGMARRNTDFEFQKRQNFAFRKRDTDFDLGQGKS